MHGTHINTLRYDARYTQRKIVTDTFRNFSSPTPEFARHGKWGEMR